VARQCDAESVDYPRFLLRITELELLDRERWGRIRHARFPVLKSLDSFSRHPVAEQGDGTGVGTVRVCRPPRERTAAGTGKTHIALALGLAARQHGHRVPTADFLEEKTKNYSAPSTVTVGGSCAFRNVKFTVAPLRTLTTSPGRKQAIHVPPSFRTLG
jgi:hypothetical protein